MAQETQKWPAARIVHLAGGCRAINSPPGPMVILDPYSLKGGQGEFQIKQFGAIFNILESMGTVIIGVDFYSHVLEVEGLVPTNWRSYHRTQSTSWPTEEIAQKWRNIGHAAFKQKNG